MITLEQAQRIVEEGERLRSELQHIDSTIASFHCVEGDVVMCRAYAASPGGAEPLYYARNKSSVEVLPIPKSQALSALNRQRSKLVARFAELGVEAPPAPKPIELSSDCMVIGTIDLIPTGITVLDRAHEG
jgi:hypothetical protein